MRTIRFGRIGSQGQEKVTTFPGEAEARAEYEALLKQKLKKGYVLELCLAQAGAGKGDEEEG